MNEMRPSQKLTGQAATKVTSQLYELVINIHITIIKYDSVISGQNKIVESIFILFEIKFICIFSVAFKYRIFDLAFKILTLVNDY